MAGDETWIYFFLASPEVPEHDVARQNGGALNNRKDMQVNKKGDVHYFVQHEDANTRRRHDKTKNTAIVTSTPERFQQLWLN